MALKSRIAANLNWLFLEEADFVKRYMLAKSAGFQAVECADPYHIDLQKMVEARETAGVKHVLINSYKGLATEAGIAALPGRESEFLDSLKNTIEYCKALQCPRVHLMAGRRPENTPEEHLRSTFVTNLKSAAETLSAHNIQAVIEPINTSRSVPGYYLDNLQKAISIIDEVNHPNLKLQMDLFHIQIIHGNLTENITKYLPYIAHMQVAQIPDRHEPDSAGEVDFQYIFDILNKSGYEGYIGLEYKPAGDTVAGLKWMGTVL